MVVLLHFCSPTPALNRLPASGGTTEAHDIAYGGGPRHRLDLYAPNPSAAPAPVVVFFYGGGWQTGEKDWYRFVGEGLVTRGVLVVIPDYRLYPEVRFPAFMDDAAQAVAWVRTNAARFGGDPRRLFLMGHSAGAQIAMLLALDSSYLAAAGLSPHDVCGVVGMAGPYDFLPLATPTMQAMFGQVPDLARTQPINYATPGAPPSLLMAGTWDSSVNPANTSRMAARLQSAGDAVDVLLYYGLTHTALIESIAAPLAFISPAREDLLRFIAAHAACAR
jgi:acetyl esterase/lipase